MHFLTTLALTLAVFLATSPFSAFGAPVSTRDDTLEDVVENVVKVLDVVVPGAVVRSTPEDVVENVVEVLPVRGDAQLSPGGLEGRQVLDPDSVLDLV